MKVAIHIDSVTQPDNVYDRDCGHEQYQDNFIRVPGERVVDGVRDVDVGSHGHDMQVYRAPIGNDDLNGNGIYLCSESAKISHGKRLPHLGSKFDTPI